MNIARRLNRLVSLQVNLAARRKAMFEIGVGSSNVTTSESSDSSTSGAKIVPPSIERNKLNSALAFEPADEERIKAEYQAYRLWLHQQGRSTRE